MKEKEELLSEREAEIVGYRERLSFLLEDKGEIKELRTLLANLREEGEEEEEEEEDEEEEEEEEKNNDMEEEKGEETKENDNVHSEEEKNNENQNEKTDMNSTSMKNEKSVAASMSLQLPDRRLDVGISVGTNTSLTNSTDMSGVEGTMESSSSSVLQGLSPLMISALLTPPRMKVPVPTDTRVIRAEDGQTRARGGGGRGGGEGGGGGARDGTQHTQSVQTNSRPSSKETAVTGWHTRELL